MLLGSAASALEAREGLQRLQVVAEATDKYVENEADEVGPMLCHFIDFSRSAIRILGPWLVLVLMASCAGIRNSGSGEFCRYEGPVGIVSPSDSDYEKKVGNYVQIEGMVYLGYHDSGFIAEEYWGESASLFQKVVAFCIEIDDGCWPRIERARHRYWSAYPDGGEPLFSFSGAALVLPHLRRPDAIGQNSCTSGNLRIVEIRKLKPIRRRVSF